MFVFLSNFDLSVCLIIQRTVGERLAAPENERLRQIKFISASVAPIRLPPVRTDNALCAYVSASAEGGGGERVNSKISIIIFVTQAPSVAYAPAPSRREPYLDARFIYRNIICCKCLFRASSHL